MGENGEDNYYLNNFNYNKTHNELDRHVSLASFAMFTGIIAIPMCIFAYTGVILGGVAVVLALLSKGTLQKMLPQAKRAILFGSAAIVIGYAVLVSSFHLVLTDPEARKQINIMSERINGESFDDMLKDMGLEDLGVEAGE